MSKKIIYIARLILITLCLCFAGSVNVSFAAEFPSVAGQVYKAEGLTKDKFNALPDNAVIEVKGVQMTKQQLIASKKQKRDEAISRMKTKAAVPNTQFEAARTKFLQEQKNKLDADNAKAKTKFERMKTNSSKYAEIKNEALKLNEKSKNATPAEQEQIEKRANELVQQLKQMGY